MFYRLQLIVSAHLFFFLLVTPISADSQISPDGTRLSGRDLTPYGAEYAKSESGLVPRWNGARDRQYYIGSISRKDFSIEETVFGDSIILTIDHSNFSDQKKNLTDAHVALLSKHQGYRLNVYSPRRICTYPAEISSATRKNADSGKLVDGGNRVEGANIGVPFPVPSSGLEIIWNHNLRYRGQRYRRNVVSLVSNGAGGHSKSRITEEVEFLYSKGEGSIDYKPSPESDFYQKYKHRLFVGGGTDHILVWESFGKNRRAWRYKNQQRRVKRAPEYRYDLDANAGEGLETVDNFDLFNGAPDLYDWVVVGKFEKYIPYNTTKLVSTRLTYDDIIRDNFIDPQFLRYEPHRVWQVEARLKRGLERSHIYYRRVKYIDEDTWTVVVSELYDMRGELWRVQEGYIAYSPELSACISHAQTTYDLKSGRYAVRGLSNEEVQNDVIFEGYQRYDFGPAAIGRRWVIR